MTKNGARKRLKLLIACDIDGVLTFETNGHNYAKRTPNLPAIHYVQELMKDNKVFFFTSRFSKDRKVTERWLAKYGIKNCKIIFNKPRYDIIVDDRCCPFKT